MASWSFELSPILYEELWRRCAGPLHHLPRVGERVFYFPQGHLDQEATSSNQRLIAMLPETFNLPSRILCRVVNIELRADETDEVAAQITLLPELRQDEVTKPDPAFVDPPKPVVKSFCKVLTSTDVSSKLHVRQQDARECFPPLDMTLETPSQKLVAKDLHGDSWHFKHVHSGNPRRHLLSSGWKHFVKAKRLVSGDSVIFLGSDNGELRVGIRRAFSFRQGRYVPQQQVLAAASNGFFTSSLFTVFYRPSSGIRPFIVGLNKSIECAKNLCSIGMRFSMRFERDDHLLGRCTGTIVEVGDASPYWKDSPWQCLKVKWDESATVISRERVSPWEIDHIDLHTEQRYVKRNRVKKSRQAICQQNRIENVGQVICQQNRTSLQEVSRICQQGWVANGGQSSHQDQPRHDNWLNCMLDHDVLGCGLNSMSWGQFRAVSPTIHFSQLEGCQGVTLIPRVSMDSEESVQGEVTKRKKTSVGDEERRVKSKIEASQCGAGSDSFSNETHYSSALEGEPNPGKCNEESTLVEGAAGASDRPIIHRLKDRVFGFLHQLKDYVV